MLVTLPLLAFLLLFVFLLLRSPAESDLRPDWRDAFAEATVLWGLLVVAILLVLSPLHAVAQGWVALAWLAVDAVLVLVLARLLRAEPCSTLRVQVRPETPFRLSEKVMLISIAILVLLTGLVAVFAGPTESDSISYHLPRVVHWAQDHSVAPFATPNSRQIWAPPWTEYVALHLLVLLKGDRLVNLVQWFAAIAALIVVSRIAALVGLHRGGQIASALVAATIPMLIDEASTLMTDGSAAFWVICVAWIVFRARVRRSSWSDWRLLGGALGLAALTKSSALIYSLPMVLWFAWYELRRLSAWVWLRRGLAMGGIAAALALINWLPNWLLLGSPFGSPEHLVGIMNGAIGLRLMLSNAIRSLALLASTPFDRVNDWLLALAGLLHRPLGLTLSQPEITYGQGQFSQIIWLWPGETSAPIHLALAVTVVFWTLFRKRAERTVPKVMLAILPVSGFLLFNLLVRLQQGSRFHIALLVLGAPLVADLLSQTWSRRLAPVILAALVIAALPVAATDRWRPLLRIRPLVWNQSVLIRPREEMYFLQGPDPQAAHAAAAAVESTGCHQIGLILDSDDWEYGWWTLFDPLRAGYHIEHLLVFPAFDAFRDPSFAPCAIVCSICDESWSPRQGIVGKELGPQVWLYLPAGSWP